MYAGPLSRTAAEPSRPSPHRLWFLVWLIGLGVLGTAGCTKTIGDSCATNVECSPLGDRFCDLASPNGYCTIEGCDSASCPDSAVCIRFFSLKLGGAQCNASLVPMAPADCANSSGCCVVGTPGCCQIGEHCLCDQDGCGAKGYCASESTERRWCMHTCNSNSDCRDGYQCLTTGANGSLAVAVPDLGNAVPILRYCAPPK
jgi:hypothetical protein